MIDLTRKQFLSVLAGGICLSNQFVQTVPNNNAEEFPFYLKGYEAQYHINPRATAIEWHRYAKWGFSDSSFFIYGCIGRSVFLL